VGWVKNLFEQRN